MNLSLKYYSFYILIILLLSSCSSMYIPSTVNIPLLEEKGEGQGELTLSTNSFHLTGNYAFSKRFSAMINGGLSYKNVSEYYDIFTTKRSTEDGFIDDWGLEGEFAHSYIEAGIGRYNILQSKAKLEIFGGAGYGYATDKAYSSIGTLHFDADYILGFLQINFGFTNAHFNFGGALRAASSAWNYHYQIDPDSEGSLHYDGASQATKFSLFHIEPIFFFRVGDEKIRFVLQAGLSGTKPINSLHDLNVKKGIFYGEVNYTMVHFSMGLNFRFDLNKKKSHMPGVIEL